MAPTPLVPSADANDKFVNALDLPEGLYFAKP